VVGEVQGPRWAATPKERKEGIVGKAEEGEKRRARESSEMLCERSTLLFPDALASLAGMYTRKIGRPRRSMVGGLRRSRELIEEVDEMSQIAGEAAAGGEGMVEPMCVPDPSPYIAPARALLSIRNCVGGLRRRVLRPLLPSP
jgi:hypothetical protein